MNFSSFKCISDRQKDIKNFLRVIRSSCDTCGPTPISPNIPHKALEDVLSHFTIKCLLVYVGKYSQSVALTTIYLPPKRNPERYAELTQHFL